MEMKCLASTPLHPGLDLDLRLTLVLGYPVLHKQDMRIDYKLDNPNLFTPVCSQLLKGMWLYKTIFCHLLVKTNLEVLKHQKR